MYEVKLDKLTLIIQVLQSLNHNLRFEGNKNAIRVISKEHIANVQIPKGWEYDRETGMLMGGDEETFLYKLVFVTQ